MSGGSYDYAQYKLEEIADRLRRNHPDSAPILALAAHFLALATVMHEIEWADSGDTSWNPELLAHVRGVVSPEAELDAARLLANAAHRELVAALERVPHGR